MFKITATAVGQTMSGPTSRGLLDVVLIRSNVVASDYISSLGRRASSTACLGDEATHQVVLGPVNHSWAAWMVALVPQRGSDDVAN